MPIARPYRSSLRLSPERAHGRCLYRRHDDLQFASVGREISDPFPKLDHALACHPAVHDGIGVLQIVQTRESQNRMQIIVRDNNVDQALRVLKKRLQREGVYREMKLRRHYEKPSEKRARERAAAISRARKADRKRAERDK